MSLKFTIQSKTQSKKPSKSFAAVPVDPSASADAGNPPAKNYVTEFNATEAPPPESNVKRIAPIADKIWHHNKKLKNLQGLASISTGADASLQFELDPLANKSEPENSMGFGLNLRQPVVPVDGNVPTSEAGEVLGDSELRKLRKDLENAPDHSGMAEFEDVPVEGYGAALLMGYGWKEGRGIGRNAKEDTKVTEVKRKSGKGGLGFTGDLPGNHNARNNSDVIGNNGNAVGVMEKKTDNEKEKNVLGDVRIVNGRDIGRKGKIIEVRSSGDIYVLRISRSHDKVKVRSRDVVEVGSLEEEKFLRKWKELETTEEDLHQKDKSDRNTPSKKIREKDSKKINATVEKVNWLRSHIRVKVVSEKFKGGRLYLRKGVVVDVVGPGICDIEIDGSRELVQGVDQDLLETALPKRGGPVLVLYGKHKGMYGSLLERDTEKETGVVQDADTHEFLNVKLEQIAEFVGDPSDIGY